MKGIKLYKAQLTEYLPSMNNVPSSVPMCLVVPVYKSQHSQGIRKIRSSTSALLHSEFKAHLVYVSIAAWMERYPSQGTPQNHRKHSSLQLCSREKVSQCKCNNVPSGGGGRMSPSKVVTALFRSCGM